MSDTRGRNNPLWLSAVGRGRDAEVRLQADLGPADRLRHGPAEAGLYRSRDHLYTEKAGC